MNTYLTIMVTILVLTQIVRIIQNTIQLRRQYKELECYGIVKMEKVGSWANELFLVGTWHNGDAAVNFEYDIKSRGLTLYRHKPEEGAV